MGIAFKRVVKQYPNAALPAVDDVTLDIREGEFVVLLGPSGCGKTTLLKMVNRLYDATSGTIEIDGADIRTFQPETLRRGIGYVIQQNGLFPHMTIEDNIAIVPRLLRWDEARIDERIDELLELVHLDPATYRKRRPSQLSGGQQQRVGIARAMAADPSILLMDEPFGAIDAITRASLQEELLRIQKRLRKTILFVTHDVDEAFRLADKIVVMQAGKVVQYGAPIDMLTKPSTPFIRQLVGERDAYRKMGLMRVRDVLEPAAAAELNAGAATSPGEIEAPERSGAPGDPFGRDVPVVSVEDDLRKVFDRMVEEGARMYVVADAQRRPVGTVTMDAILSKLAGSGREAG